MHTHDNLPRSKILHIASGDLWAGAEVQLFTLSKSLHCNFDAPISVVLLFIETAMHTHEHHPDLKTIFHIYGDGPIREELENLSRELETDSFVHFEGHCDNIVTKLEEMDILLMTSDHEGLPMILLEAMALQLPVIAHAVGGIPVLLDQGSCGVLVYKHNAQAYGNEIYQLAHNPELYSNIQQKAQARVCTRYSADKNAGVYLLEYRERNS
jgi:glycosyltransferase involved in cell wall biosynthesis